MLFGLQRCNQCLGSTMLWHLPLYHCSDDGSFCIIAKLASTHYHSSIYKPLCGLQDIADHLHTPSVEDELLLSVVARCRWISSRDICVNLRNPTRFIGERGSLSNFCWLAHHWQQVHRHSMWRFHLFISAHRRSWTQGIYSLRCLASWLVPRTYI